MKFLGLLIVAVLVSGCSGLQSFHNGMLALADTMPKTETTCVTGSFGVECISYTVPNTQLSPRQEAEIEQRVTQEYLEEKRQREADAQKAPTI
ncbi:hypothetical protein JF535_13180 [Microbulbifer salipaludis]|uniref:Lipoprotein n=1 Tax=Microbulbifer salipaludis TaxID=187980 RepID=A0ABS3E9R6_9GAMM|nr:hypothetical protein [Microbulbifer salipaludis]MBN8431804.1 hypothetical protein [Microbulbifer salipaludis]